MEATIDTSGGRNLLRIPAEAIERANIIMGDKMAVRVHRGAIHIGFIGCKQTLEPGTYIAKINRAGSLPLPDMALEQVGHRAKTRYEITIEADHTLILQPVSPLLLPVRCNRFFAENHHAAARDIYQFIYL